MSGIKVLLTVFTIFALLAMVLVLTILWCGWEKTKYLLGKTSMKVNDIRLTNLLNSTHKMVTTIYLFTAIMLILTLFVSLLVLLIEAIVVHR